METNVTVSYKDKVGLSSASCASCHHYATDILGGEPRIRKEMGSLPDYKIPKNSQVMSN